jgi:hypothetical protein
VCAPDFRRDIAGMRRYIDVMSASRQRAGQVLTEYLVMAGMLTATVLIAALFLYTFKEYGGRVLDLLSSEYP